MSNDICFPDKVEFKLKYLNTISNSEMGRMTVDQMATELAGKCVSASEVHNVSHYGQGIYANDINHDPPWQSLLMRQKDYNMSEIYGTLLKTALSSSTSSLPSPPSK